MARYRKKPVVVKAWPVNNLNYMAQHDFGGLPSSIQRAYDKGDLIFSIWDGGSRGINVRTLEGIMYAGPDDWIIRGVQGELYPCKPDIFEATYEPV